LIKNWGRPIHGVICKEDQIDSVIHYRVEKKLRSSKSKQEYKFSEDEINFLKMRLKNYADRSVRYIQKINITMLYFLYLICPQY